MDKAKFFAKFNTPKRVEAVDPNDPETVFVREISAKELSEFQMGAVDKKGRPTGLTSFRERLVALCACDKDGKRLFDNSDEAAIAQLPASAVEPIVEAAQRLNKIGAVVESDEAKKN